MNIDFYNVQRLKLNSGPFQSAIGLDRVFSIEYMGNASYEYALSPSLKRMRASGQLGTRAYQLTGDGVTRTIHLFGALDDLDEQFAGLDAWAHGTDGRRPFHAEELTYFDRVFLGTSPDYCQTVAWWSLAGDIMWSLDQDVAEKIAEAVMPLQTSDPAPRRRLLDRLLGR